jgi:formyltetrahydrofolate-dependent phosphoribosylglycinamide formyltransferase
MKLKNTPARLAVLISGNGSNLQAVLDACAGAELSAQVVVVISNKPEAYGLVRAVNANVAAIPFPVDSGESRRDYDARLAVEVALWRPDYVILAGWMRLLSSTFLDFFPGHVINLHPALPGTFPGTHAIEKAYQAWRKAEIDRSGVMVHFVPDEGVDDGPVIAYQEIVFHTGESLEEYEMRVHEIEHSLLIRALKKVTIAD